MTRLQLTVARQQWFIIPTPASATASSRQFYTPLCTECQHLKCTNYSLPRILLLTWFCLFFAIFQQVSDSNVTLKLPLASCPLPNTVQNRYTIYKTLATCQPSYLYNLLQLHQPSRALRSSTQQLLQVPYMSTDFGRRAFSYSSPVSWNFIPTSIKNCSSLYIFKRHLKSHLIAQLINN